MLTFKPKSQGLYDCTLDLDQLFTKAELKNFNTKWKSFYASDKTHPFVLKREGNIISYPHKYWIPDKKSDRHNLLVIGGNPAPHSVWKDIFFAYEGKGTEHRFWKVLRELGYLDIDGHDTDIKNKIYELNYTSPFKLGIDAIYTFPSPASEKNWSGVMGLEKLFGKKVLRKIMGFEKLRVQTQLKEFFKDGGTILAMQKDAYNALSDNTYDVKKALEGKLRSKLGNVNIIGTPPTRWLHTKKMKALLTSIKNELVN